MSDAECRPISLKGGFCLPVFTTFHCLVIINNVKLINKSAENQKLPTSWLPRRRISRWLIAFIVGLLITAFGLLPLPINSTGQCPDNATVMPDGSSCIVGAPIGPPIWLVGILVALVGAWGLSFCRVLDSFRKREK